MSTGWGAYFNDLHEASPLYREQSALYVESILGAVGLRPEDRVLDFGCGFGLVAALLASHVAEVWVWDPAANMRSAAARSTAHLVNVRFCDLSVGSGADPHEHVWTGLPFDLILVNSVAQYMRPDDLWAWLGRWRTMLVPDGRVVLSDLIPTGHGGVSDIADLVRLGARHGSPLRATREALGGLRRYWRMSRTEPLVRVDPAQLARRAAAANLEMTTLPRNLTHFGRRWTAVLAPRTENDAEGPRR